MPDNPTILLPLPPLPEGILREHRKSKDRIIDKLLAVRSRAEVAECVDQVTGLEISLILTTLGGRLDYVLNQDPTFSTAGSDGHAHAEFFRREIELYVTIAYRTLRAPRTSSGPS